MKNKYEILDGHNIIIRLHCDRVLLVLVIVNCSLLMTRNYNTRMRFEIKKLHSKILTFILDFSKSAGSRYDNICLPHLSCCHFLQRVAIHFFRSLTAILVKY